MWYIELYTVEDAERLKKNLNGQIYEKIHHKQPNPFFINSNLKLRKTGSALTRLKIKH